MYQYSAQEYSVLSMKHSEMILMLKYKAKMLECPLDVTEVPRVTQAPLCFEVIHECSHVYAVTVTQDIKTQLGTVTGKWSVRVGGFSALVLPGSLQDLCFRRTHCKKLPSGCRPIGAPTVYTAVISHFF